MIINRKIIACFSIFMILFPLGAAWAKETPGAPEGFVYLKELIPTLEVELRYITDNNFVGRPIDGYERPKPMLSVEAAKALKKVQEELAPFGLGLKVFDAYRPQRAVDNFVNWAKRIDDKINKTAYYPDVKKENLFKEGYIASKSGHSRGSAVDLTIVSLVGADKGKELDMGSPFDFFGPESWPENLSMTAVQRANRMLLRCLMTKHGFKPYKKEWWHFNLKNEPYPDTYFDFPVK